jgi:hypothetical protein
VIDILILQLRCGIPDCEWSLPFPVPTPYSPQALTKVYGQFRRHCADRHELNPNTNELPGLDQASFFLDVSRGAYLQVVMDSVIDEVEFEDSLNLD